MLERCDKCTHAGISGGERRFGNRLLLRQCTIEVQNIDETIRAIEAAGGKIVMAKSQIPTVVTGVYFSDTEGDFVGAMQPENTGK